MTCDDGDAGTINDMQTVLDCDGSICVPCMGTPVDCSSGTTSVVSCDDGDDCTENDEQTILDATGDICVPCAGTPIDCTNGTTSVVACDDGDPCTENDMQTILDCNGEICVPCTGTIATVGAPQISSVSICQNESLPAINAIGTGNSFVWYDADPNSGVTPIFIGNNFQPNIDLSVPGTFEFWVAESSNNCEGEANSFTVTVEANPIVNAGDDLLHLQ